MCCSLADRLASRLGHGEADARLAVVAATLHTQTGPLVGQRVIVHGLGAGPQKAGRSSYAASLYRSSAAAAGPRSGSGSAAGYATSFFPNGATGLVTGYDASTDHCTVELSDGRVSKFRPENLAFPYL